MATYVDTCERSRKSAVGQSQSSAVRAMSAQANSAAQTPEFRTTKPATCRTYQRSAAEWPRAGSTVSR